MQLPLCINVYDDFTKTRKSRYLENKTFLLQIKKSLHIKGFFMAKNIFVAGVTFNVRSEIWRWSLTRKDSVTSWKVKFCKHSLQGSCSTPLFEAPTPWPRLPPPPSLLKSSVPPPLRYFRQFLPPPRNPSCSKLTHQPSLHLIDGFKQISKGWFYQFNFHFLSKINFWFFKSLWKHQVILIYGIFSGGFLDYLEWPFFIKLWWQKKIIFLWMHNTILQRVKPFNKVIISCMISHNTLAVRHKIISNGNLAVLWNKCTIFSIRC